MTSPTGPLKPSGNAPSHPVQRGDVLAALGRVLHNYPLRAIDRVALESLHDKVATMPKGTDFFHVPDKGHHGKNPGGSSGGGQSVAVASVVASVATIAGEPGDVVTFTLEAKNSVGATLTGKTFAAASANDLLVSIRSVVGNVVTCNIKGTTAGTAGVVITGSCDGQSVTVTVSATWVIASLALAPSSLALLVGGSAQIVATALNRNAVEVPGPELIGHSTNSPVAFPDVINNQTVTIDAFAVGSASITVSSRFGVVSSNAVAVTVAQPIDLVPASIAISGPTSGAVGDTLPFTAAVKNAASDTLVGVGVDAWHSSAPSVASIDVITGHLLVLTPGTTTITATKGALTSNGIVVTAIAAGSGGGGGGVNLLKHDFEDGTLGPFENPYASVGSVIDVIADPTARAAGKVCRILYENFPESGNFDSNIAIAPKPENNPGRKLGEELWCRWKFYLDTDARLPAVRKLNYWGWSNDSWGFQHGFSFVIALHNSVGAPIPPNDQQQFSITVPVVAADGTVNGAFPPGVGSDGSVDNWYGPAIVTTKAWHRMKLQLKLNSAFAVRDGILRVWYDDVLIFENLQMRFTDPSWIDDPATYQWVDYRIGEQLNGKDKLAEPRYIDDVSFATTEAALDA